MKIQWEPLKGCMFARGNLLYNQLPALPGLPSIEFMLVPKTAYKISAFTL